MIRKPRIKISDEPTTSMRPKAKPKLGKPYVPPPHKPSTWTPVACDKIGLHVDRVIEWVATVGKPHDARKLNQYWLAINERLNQLKTKLNRKAVDSLPEVENQVTFNGRELSRWIAKAGKDELADLQKIAASMRLRILKAGVIRRKRRR